MVKFMLSERGKPLAVLNNFKYYQYRILKSTEEMCWCCIDKKCRAKLYTLGSGDEPAFSRKTGEHTHEAVSECNLNRQKISNGVKRKAIDDISAKPSKLIHQELSIQSESLSTLTNRDVMYIRNSISRKKLSLAPKLPKSSAEVQDFLNKIAVKTVRGEDFLMINNMASNIVVFSTASNLKFMCNQDTFYVDGTFDYAPKHFLQLFTIHAFKNDHYIPVAFCLLKNKEKKTYSALFAAIVDKCQNIGYIWSPKYVIADFEIAIHNSIKETFVDVTMIGCRFHLSQSWWRKIQQLGLSSEYKTDDSLIGKWLHHIFGLSFLAPDEVGDSFAIDFFEDKPEDLRVTAFADYLTETYIGEDAVFPPEIWAANTASLARTTNACESFHSKYNDYCPSPHPNINVFINSINSMQMDTYVKINSVVANEKRLIRKEVLQSQKFIKDKIEQYENMDISRYDFVKCVSYKYNKTML